MRINAEQLRVLVLRVLTEYPDGLDADSLLAAVYHAEVADFTDIPDVMDRLAHDGLIVSEKRNNTKSCVITKIGREVATELKNGVPEEAVREVLLEYESISKDIVYSSKVEPASDGSAYFYGKALPGEIILADFCVRFDDEKTAHLAKHNFDRRPDAVLRAVSAVFSGNADFLLAP